MNHPDTAAARVVRGGAVPELEHQQRPLCHSLSEAGAGV